ncbi:SDR family oxidoreductase [Shouchella lehensis]|uniref:SDR family oxidoreductase n=1 Tax=Shouchella lehensis TaxID=300825 RepID=A0A4Y7WSM4_9BACI|nr:SDR family NAD(P)-dependent oxidoreductase [Shouchella lehensis]MBG9783655.1 3-ketoacyl-ACP reductase [Shouchella lehensis]TES51397.1 SDR family oxidoreductase [Shouchella lehensis]
MKHFAVITGAASGIGRATADIFIHHHVPVALIDTNEEQLNELKQANPHRTILVYKGDVSNHKEMERIFSSIRTYTSSISTLFANAGINGKVTSIEAFHPDEWDQTIQTNLRGTFLTVKHAIPFMKNHGGSIILTSSVNGTRTFSNIGMSAYSASKAGIAAFGKMAALELSSYHIRVNTLCPGAINTSIDERTYRDDAALENLTFKKETSPFPVPAADPSEVANTVYFLSSPEAKHISGTEIVIDAAQTLV